MLAAVDGRVSLACCQFSSDDVVGDDESDFEISAREECCGHVIRPFEFFSLGGIFLPNRVLETRE